MRWICGLDEAGRGPLAGPIVAAAVVAPESLLIEARDSKKLTEKRREAWAEAFRQRDDVHFYYESVEAGEINLYGISWANYEVFRRLILRIEADEYIVDGNLKIERMGLGHKSARAQSIVRADEQLPLVAAASILAKTHRDNIMRELHAQYPQYHWARNKGYGTKDHISAIKAFGNTPHHRTQFTETVKAKPYAQPLLLLGPGSWAMSLFLWQIFQNVL